MAVFRATSVSLLLALAACSVGEIPIGGATPTPDAPVSSIDAAVTIDGAGSGTPIDAPPVGGDPSASFTMIVTPIVTKDIGGKTCTQAGCHAGTFPPNLTSYLQLADKYKKPPGNTNILTTHGPHTGPALPPADAKAIAGWIDSLPVP
jgi:hypothetical protein